MQKNLEEQLSQLQLSPADLRRVLWRARWRVFRQHLGAIRPRQMLIPAMFSQVGVFVLAAFDQTNFASTWIAGNLVIVAIMLMPPVFRPAPQKVHWVE